MDTITVVFTKRKWNPISWLIRWAMPRSRFYISRSSHCLIKDGDCYIEAAMLYGVRRTEAAVALKGLTVVETISYSVPDAEAGMAWLNTQIGKAYDYKGALGISLAPDRQWAKEGWWFCYELAAATIKASGRDTFRSVGYITEAMLFTIKP